MGKYGPKKAFGLIKSYTADGDDLMAARIYSESLIGFQKYMEAVNEGRKLRAKTEVLETVTANIGAKHGE